MIENSKLAWRYKTLFKDRLAWVSKVADEVYWADYFAQLDKQYYVRASMIAISDNTQATVLDNELNKDGKHLEAGCGSGIWVRWLKDRGYNIEGIEYSGELVDNVLQIQPDLPILEGNVLEIMCSDATYDTYISFGVVEHRIDGPEPFFEEAYRVLKPEGKLIISVPNFGILRQIKSFFHLYAHSEEIKSSEFYQYAFKISEFERILVNCGFKLDYIRYYTANRLLLEELSIYRWLRQQRGSRYWRDLAEVTLSHFDGHMMLIVANKV